MRGLGTVLILLTTVLAGCIGGGSDDADRDALATLRDHLVLPEGAELLEEDGHLVALFETAESPFRTVFQVPEGATMVRFVADPGEGFTVGVSMNHNGTDRRRCNQQTVIDLQQPLTGPRSCSSLTAIDPPGTEWVARASGPATFDARIEFHPGPVDGPAALLDLSQLSHATHDLQPTDGFYVESFDGTPLWAEVTLPEGEGPWPTVIAASPYNGQQDRLPDPGAEGSVGAGEGSPAMWGYWTQDYAKRGYAAVNVDVRGFGKSGGCVEVWGVNEQRDQAFIVDWVADQAWSDGKVGFYGQSYVGTTPVAAAVQTPEALKAIIAVAPVIDAYFDWHYGGVPNGESSLSPVAYQVLTDDPSQWAAYGEEDPEGFATDLPTILEYSAKGMCDPTLVPLANDPRAIHGDYYDERDFGARAGDVEAAVLYTQGFEDANVKSAMIPDWFNDIQAPKLGVFGHWLHQHPARMDAEVLFLGWMDQYVKGKDLGFEKLPQALISVDESTHRVDDGWPPQGAPETAFGLAFPDGLADEGSGSGDIPLLPLAPGVLDGEAFTFRSEPLADTTPLVDPALTLAGTLVGENGMVHATLREQAADGSSRMLTYGMFNLAMKDGYDTYAPPTPGMPFTAELPFRETEHLLTAGSTLVLEVRAVEAGESTGAAQPQPGLLMIDGAGSALHFASPPLEDYTAIPLTALP